MNNYKCKNISLITLFFITNATFFALKTHSLPLEIPNPPKDWSKPYRKLSREINFKYQSLAEANQAIMLFLNPVLSGEIIQRWNPLDWKWE